MSTANNSPIFSRLGDCQGGVVLTTAANDYTGQNINNAIVFTSDTTNGGFLQRLRFKALGTNVATVCRVYGVAANTTNLAASISAVSGTPTGTPSTSGGTLLSGTYFAKIVAVDPYGAMTAVSTETASVSVTGPTGSIAWAWTASTGAASYMIFVGPVTGGQCSFFTSSTNAFTQTVAIGTRETINGSIITTNLYGEVALPATTAIATTSTVDIDYPMNFALPPGGRILVGLGTTVAAGWTVSAIGGKY